MSRTNALHPAAQMPPGMTTVGTADNCRQYGAKRRGWDSNPRWSYPHSGFRDRPIQPLSHLSAKPKHSILAAKRCEWFCYSVFLSKIEVKHETEAEICHSCSSREQRPDRCGNGGDLRSHSPAGIRVVA